jgi:mannose-1-phosphate guanylyltransferase/6-phosphogluconolactonase/glucosamine-6-phosphate isomerase/deaminase
VIALVLAGGHGRRLWPLSTPGHPKPFRSLFDAEPPVRRVLRQCEAWLGAASSVWLAIGDAQIAAARAAVPDLERYTVFPEAHATETTTVIARAALALERERPDDVLAVLAADQRLEPDTALWASLDRAVCAARRGPYLVSLGIRPNLPETAYGYMQLGAPLDGAEGAFEGLGYVEKPDLETATRLVASGRSIWNAGLFAFRVDTLLASLRRHVPDVVEALARGCPPERPVRAIDYELMERVTPGQPERHAFVVADCSFHDFGNLAALASAARPDPSGNRARGDVAVEASRDCTILCEAPRRLRVTGLTGATVAVGAEGNVLVSGPRGAEPEAPPTVELLTRGAGCYAEVRTSGVEVDVRVGEDEVVVASRAARAARSGRAGARERSIEVQRCADEGAVARASAALIVETLRRTIERRGRAVWVPSTGRTVVGCYALLADRYRDAVDWGRVEVFQMDELADVAEPLAARTFLRERLVEPLGIGRAVLMSDASSAVARSVERELLEARPDLVVHGMGENGHLGLNEPGSPFDVLSGEVVLEEETRRAKGLASRRGATLGLGALLAIPRALLLVTGAHKRRALERALFGPATPAVPASGLQLRGRVTVIADAAAWAADVARGRA